LKKLNWKKFLKEKKLNRKTQFRKVQKYFFFSFLVPLLGISKC